MIITRFVLEARTPLHCGGGSDPLLDQPVTRDAFGLYRIQGSSIAGCLRERARQMLDNGSDAATLSSVFGSLDDPASPSSMIWCTDALLLDFDGKVAARKAEAGERVLVPQGPFVRDHVRISDETGTAERGGKFDEEIVPPGARFVLALKLDGWAGTPSERQKEIFLALCASLKSGDIRLGGKRVSGYGRLRTIECTCSEFDFSRESDTLAWLRLTDPLAGPVRSGRSLKLPEPQGLEGGKGISADLTLPLTPEGPVLVGGNNARGGKDAEVDIACLTTPCLDYKEGRAKHVYTIPGSSLRGVLRHRVIEIARSLGLDHEAIANGLFGHVKGKESEAGKCELEDIYLENGKATVLQHVAIDSFTGGAFEGALFDEAPLWSSDLAMQMRIRAMNLCPQEARLLCHALLDLASGELGVGNGINRGNGRLRLKGLAENPGKALSAVAIEACWDGQRLNAKDPGMAKEWLRRLEEGA